MLASTALPTKIVRSPSTASAEQEDEDWNDREGDDRYAMMGHRDYSFEEFDGEDEGQA